MTLDEFKKDIYDNINNLPSNWRKGQKVYNYINRKYNVARQVQFDDGIDCFYNDAIIEPFIDASYKYISGFAI